MLATPLHALTMAGQLAYRRFHSNSAGRLGPSRQIRTWRTNTRSATVDSLGESTVNKTLIHSALHGLNFA